jgi:hypothetical protein
MKGVRLPLPAKPPKVERQQKGRGSYRRREKYVHLQHGVRVLR